MHKSIYSVLLSDGLVARLDDIAYKKGVSRSAMLDRVLAEYLAEETVEMKMNNVFESVERMIDGYAGLRFNNQASDYMASVQSALAYRYNKISLRTKSEVLLGIMERFYSFFISLEKKYIGERAYAYDGNRFVRAFVRPDGLSAQKAGESIAEYVADFDKYLRIYFSSLDNERAACKAVEKEYAGNIVKKEVIL